MSCEKINRSVLKALKSWDSFVFSRKKASQSKTIENELFDFGAIPLSSRNMTSLDEDTSKIDSSTPAEEFSPDSLEKEVYQRTPPTSAAKKSQPINPASLIDERPRQKV